MKCEFITHHYARGRNKSEPSIPSSTQTFPLHSSPRPTVLVRASASLAEHFRAEAREDGEKKIK